MASSLFLDEAPEDRDRRFVLHDVPWSMYEDLRERLGDGIRMTYWRGALELMSPSFRHEDLKKLIARLLETWAVERGVDLNGYGNVTLKQPEERALEPDECYCLGQVHETPDLAIEVVVSAAYLDKLKVYAGLGVRELWVYKATDQTAAGQFIVLVLVAGQYEPRPRSEVLPDIDLTELSAFVKAGANQSAQVRAYQQVLRRSSLD